MRSVPRLELRDRLLRQAADTMEDFTPDPAEISKAVEEQLDTMSAQLAQNNLTLDDYCKFSNSTLEQLREDARPGAEEAVRIKALVRRVAQAEELHAHEEDVAQALSEICRANHMTMEELQPYYDDAFWPQPWNTASCWPRSRSASAKAPLWTRKRKANRRSRIGWAVFARFRGGRRGSFFTKNRHDEQNNFDLSAGL